ncbi:hypothetical protein ACP70R_039611 [Stipagrostis hirtigluma subsp. patula]
MSAAGAGRRPCSAGCWCCREAAGGGLCGLGGLGLRGASHGTGHNPQWKVERR